MDVRHSERLSLTRNIDLWGPKEGCTLDLEHDELIYCIIILVFAL